MKKQGLEKERGPRIPEINNFLDTEIARFEERINQQKKVVSPIEPLNDLFRKILDEVWRRRRKQDIIRPVSVIIL